MGRRRRAVMLLSMAALGLSAASFAACSSASPHGFTVDDAGVDVTVPIEASVEADVPDHAIVDAGPVDSALPVEGGCSVVNTACDLVTQNCPAGQECATVDAGTACIDVVSTRHLPKGHACCASATDDPCGPGLHCIGPRNDCTGDAGLTGRCTPACCTGDVCGKSDPEGFAGRCDLSIVDGKGQERFKVCDYDPPCRPFHLESCPANFTCVTEDQYGTSSCIGIYAPVDGGTIPTGYTEGAACDTSNGCADGMACLGQADGGSTCTWLCLEPNSKPPFDAGAARDGGPGYGGCPAGETCQGTVTGLPLWLLFCTP